MLGKSQPTDAESVFTSSFVVVVTADDAGGSAVTCSSSTAARSPVPEELLSKGDWPNISTSHGGRWAHREEPSTVRGSRGSTPGWLESFASVKFAGAT